MFAAQTRRFPTHGPLTSPSDEPLVGETYTGKGQQDLPVYWAAWGFSPRSKGCSKCGRDREPEPQPE